MHIYLFYLDSGPRHEIGQAEDAGCLCECLIWRRNWNSVGKILYQVNYGAHIVSLKTGASCIH